MTTVGAARGPPLADVRDLPFARPADVLTEQRAAAVDERWRLALHLGRTIVLDGFEPNRGDGTRPNRLVVRWQDCRLDSVVP
ncbi:MAG: hypothetical protein DLM62_11360 [Pseudonocardiales bacterium]|nr:MAG: hypothetical protein DLM62_11360 [Pseudonocardiales bacterium]